MRSLTFTHDDLFTIATDERGLQYCVLLASGQPGLHFRLEPWAPNNARTTHKGRWIKESDPLHASIEAAETVRRERVLAKPLTASQRQRFEAETL